MNKSPQDILDLLRARRAPITAATGPIGSTAGQSLGGQNVGSTNAKTSGGLNIGSAVMGSGVSINVPHQNYSIGYTTNGFTIDASIPKEATTHSPVLPPLTFRSHDDWGHPVNMTLTPESNISAIEALKLTMMLVAYTEYPNSFSPIEYVKAQNLERHFKFNG